MSETKQRLTYQEVWDTLHQINVEDHIKKKGDLSYLSWAWAWQVMMENYPQIEVEFDPIEYHKDDSCTVHCTVRIDGLYRSMFLPVMTGFKNSAVKNPSSRDIGDAKMRCMVKAFALYGLAHYIYAGEDLPRVNERARTARNKEVKEIVGSAKEAVKEVAEELDEAVDISDTVSDPDPPEEGDAEDLNRAVEDTMTVFLQNVETIDQLKGTRMH